MDKMMKDCLKPHSLLHTVAGIGIGLVLSVWLAQLSSSNVLLWGVILIVVGVLGEFLIESKKR